MLGKKSIIRAAFLQAFFFACSPIHAEELRDRVVAGFVFNFIKFAEWPALPVNSPINLCVTAAPDMVSIFSEFTDKIVLGRRLQVIDAQTSPAGQCQVLFVAQGLSPPCNCHCLEGAPQLLLVSDTPGYTERCGIIGLYEEDNRLRFEVNLANVERSGIRLGSQLLRLARILKENNP